MNTSCPECDATYNITEAHVGRKLTCKNCSTRLIVTERGLERKNAAAASAPPPASEFAFEGGGEDRPHSRGRDRDDDDESPRRPRKSRGRRDDHDDDNDGDRGRSRGRRPDTGPRPMKDYLAFRKMIVPLIIQVIFWFFTAVILIGAVGYLIMSLASGVTAAILTGLAVLIVGAPLYILLIRIYCEVLIVIFRMNDTLTDIKAVLEKQQSPQPPASP
ncbi:MAG TPA: DUF4282 domain-containing protein [Gemmataceae bacterium]